MSAIFLSYNLVEVETLNVLTPKVPINARVVLDTFGPIWNAKVG